ncbi:hypothetical protein [Streptomyces acidicola]|uniref:Uncharacterized protein n=1 Tax=Streptomyces acidicola TaxID=2596892 RepID=A0A5N8WL48_9ACTN|nr:hypothetical protein [Streptomyces acidicola]MPY47095.1 hypothetical protein [Streptomyces acidicola]MPY47234.1 hypothetical protein [Streptomyces acidicola]
MTPTEEITTATARLRVLTGELGDCRGPWYIDNREKRPYPQTISNKGVPYVVATTTTDPHVPPYMALYICAVHPGVGKALADWLDSWTGIELREDAALPEDARHALAVARAINQAS